MSLRPPHPVFSRSVTIESKSSVRSCRVAQMREKTLVASRSTAGSSTRFVISMAMTEITVYEYLLHATRPPLPLEKACIIPPPPPPCWRPDWTDAHTCVTWSLIGIRVRVSTLALAAQMSTVPWPYWLMPFMTRASGCAMDTSAGERRDAMSERLCQKMAAASSALSKKSSRANDCAPQLVRTEWYMDEPGGGHACPAPHMLTSPGVYTTPPTTNLSKNTPELSTSARKLPTRGSRCMDGHSATRVELGTAVCQIVSRIRMVDGLSQ